VSFADVLGQVLGAADAAVDGGLVRRVTIESSLTPRIELTRPLAIAGDDGTTPAPASFDWAQLVRPSITVELAAGQVVKFEPYGPPRQGPGALAGVGLLVVLALAAYGAYRLVR